MITVLIFIFLLILSYFLGCLSTSRLIAKSFRSLNIYKIGSGHPDTQNIYNNISKLLGIFAGIVDFSKIYIYLFLLDKILGRFYGSLANQNYLLILGFVMIIGHCLPVTHYFKGGRGIFTYMGFMAFFAPYPLIIVSILALVVVLFFNQIRFAQYMIVLLPPFVSFFFQSSIEFLGKLFIAAILMGIINIVVSKRLGEI
ncbi:MAG: glycerol-3-phosphate acyltransferase [Candidatus Cloacimonadota bacterium]|nr:glycerol-3-phosphate acyltransferase [Candidatus Cloacimonadota bacterium]